MELLVHIGARSTHRDDERYKAMAVAYARFEPLRAVRANETNPGERQDRSEGQAGEPILLDSKASLDLSSMSAQSSSNGIQEAVESHRTRRSTIRVRSTLPKGRRRTYSELVSISPYKHMAKSQRLLDTQIATSLIESQLDTNEQKDSSVAEVAIAATSRSTKRRRLLESRATQYPRNNAEDQRSTQISTTSLPSIEHAVDRDGLDAPRTPPQHDSLNSRLPSTYGLSAPNSFDSTTPFPRIPVKGMQPKDCSSFEELPSSVPQPLYEIFQSFQTEDTESLDSRRNDGASSGSGSHHAADVITELTLANQVDRVRDSQSEQSAEQRKNQIFHNSSLSSSVNNARPDGSSQRYSENCSPGLKSLTSSTKPSSSVRKRRRLHYMVISPPLEIGSVENWRRYSFMTDILKTLVNDSTLAARYQPDVVSKELPRDQKGWWFFDTRNYPRLLGDQSPTDKQEKFWELLCKRMMEGKVGPMLWCRRNRELGDRFTDHAWQKDTSLLDVKSGLGEVCVATWGELAGATWLLLYALSDGKVEKCGSELKAMGKGGELELVARMKPRRVFQRRLDLSSPNP